MRDRRRLFWGKSRNLHGVAPEHDEALRRRAIQSLGSVQDFNLDIASRDQGCRFPGDGIEAVFRDGVSGAAGCRSIQ